MKDLINHLRKHYPDLDPVDLREEAADAIEKLKDENAQLKAELAALREQWCNRHAQHFNTEQGCQMCAYESQTNALRTKP